MRNAGMPIGGEDVKYGTQQEHISMLMFHITIYITHYPVRWELLMSHKRQR